MALKRMPLLSYEIQQLFCTDTESCPVTASCPHADCCNDTESFTGTKDGHHLVLELKMAIILSWTKDGHHLVLELKIAIILSWN